MPLLPDSKWKPKYTRTNCNLVADFYIPALQCAQRYDRTTGYFSATALAIASRGIEGLIRNGGVMRLIVGCTLEPPEIAAIEKGSQLRDVVADRLSAIDLAAPDLATAQALELLAWMVSRGILEVKVAVPVDHAGHPVATHAIFHEKAGIIEDKAGHRLAFNGSINETAYGWQHNWESFHVYVDWKDTADHVDEEEQGFARLWVNMAPGLRVIAVPQAVEERLLQFLPPADALPARLAELPIVETPAVAAPLPIVQAVDPDELRGRIWSLIEHAPAVPGSGDLIGAATSAVEPWPHQMRAFDRMYRSWPCRLLIADEVGLGKTIEAGLLLRQAWLSGRAKRILIIAPKAVLTQWQIELREKFNLNWPIYDGASFQWYPSRPLVELGKVERTVSRAEWHREPFVLTSSHLMRRTERQPELLADAEPWDLVVVDEAHHARRRGAGGATDKGPNLMLQLLRGLRQRTQALLLLTATPMQIHPVEIWDLLHVLGVPEAWSAKIFERYFELVAAPNLSDAELDLLAHLFQANEAHFGLTQQATLNRLVGAGSPLRLRKVLAALRDAAATPRHRLSAEERQLAQTILKASSPVANLVSRHTRELLRAYFRAGKISSRIADRDVQDVFVEMSPAERDVYEAVEDYISTTYNSAAAKERNAVGFVMTIYRRRVASSFAALSQTLMARLAGAASPTGGLNLLEDASDDSTREEEMDDAEAGRLAGAARQAEEQSDIQALLAMVRALPPDTKAQNALQVLRNLFANGHRQAIVFTQFTDTIDFLRGYLVSQGLTVMCYSGRGGEVLGADGTWKHKSRDDTKRYFKQQGAQVLLCTDAAAEGLNFQFCGALLNYDMPWNPMRVEQRIGRIDRLGQAFSTIRIINLHYANTVEADVYTALRDRIQLFGSVVGRLQPILARLPRTIAELSLSPERDRKLASANAVRDLQGDIDNAQRNGFDLDAITAADMEPPPRVEPAYDLAALAGLLHRPDLLPAGYSAIQLGAAEFKLQVPGLRASVRVATSREFYDEQPESCELWSPGSTVFPRPPASDNAADVAGLSLADVVHRGAPR